MSDVFNFGGLFLRRADNGGSGYVMGVSSSSRGISTMTLRAIHQLIGEELDRRDQETMQGGPSAKTS